MRTTINSIFTISKTNRSSIRAHYYLLARRFILNYRLKVSDIKLDIYLRDHFGLGLKEICLKLLDRADINIDNNNLVFIFKDRKDTNLADLITYGNGIILGSPILINALR